MLDDLALMDATAQADAVRRGDVSARELVELSITAIEQINPVLNAVIHERFERARNEAEHAIDADTPFAGVPFVVKDLIAHSAGDPFHEGIATLADERFVEESDTDLVSRFRAAGLITVGRSNTAELGLLPTTEPIACGPTRNPWDPGTHTAGLERRVGRRGGGRDRVAGACERWRRVDPWSGERMWSRRAEAEQSDACRSGLSSEISPRASWPSSPSHGRCTTPQTCWTRSSPFPPIGEPYVAPQPSTSFAAACRRAWPASHRADDSLAGHA